MPVNKPWDSLLYILRQTWRVTEYKYWYAGTCGGIKWLEAVTANYPLNSTEGDSAGLRNGKAAPRIGGGSQ